MTKRKTASNPSKPSQVEKRKSPWRQMVFRVEKYILEKLWNCFPEPVRSVLQALAMYSMRLALGMTFALLLIFSVMTKNLIVYPSGAIYILEEKFGHASYERRSEIDTLINDLDRLRILNPKKEVHAIISGGPGSGKSELARQLGQRIWDRDNRLFNLIDISPFWSSADVITLNAEDLSKLQNSLNIALNKLQGKDEFTSEDVVEVNDQNVFIKFHQLRLILKGRSTVSSHPVIIFDNVKHFMFTFLYKRHSNGKFFVHAGDDKYGEIRIIVTSEYRPMTNNSLISYMNLFDPMPIDEAVKLLNKVSNIYNDDKNASYLAQALGGLPLSLANAAMYIQVNRRYQSSYLLFLKEFELSMEIFRHNVNSSWSYASNEGTAVYNKTAATASLMVIEQLMNLGDYHFYRDLACFVGFCGSPVISLQYFIKYVQLNNALDHYTDLDIKLLVRRTPMFELKSDTKHDLIYTHQVTRDTSRIACHRKMETEESNFSSSNLENAIRKIFHVLKSELTSASEPSLNQMVEYTSLNFKVIDVVMSLISNVRKHKVSLPDVITKEFCLLFLDSLADAYLYWPNKRKSAVIMPDVEFLVVMIEQNFLEQNSVLAVLLSVLYLHNTGNQRPDELARVVAMIENFTRSSLSSIDEMSVERTTLLINMIGTVYRGVAQNLSKAQELHELALDISKSYNLSCSIAVSLHLVGIIHRYQKNLDTALKYHENAVHMGRKLFSTRHSQGRLAAFLLNLAVVYNRLGHLEKSRATYLETLKITREVYGARDQRVGRVLNTFSTNSYSLGKYEESIQALNEALSLHEEIHGDYHPNVAETLYFLGFTYRAHGDLQNSLDVLQRSLKIREQYYGSHHYQVAEVLHDLSNTQRELNMLDEALRNAQRCVEIFRNTLNENSSEFGVALNGLGHVYLAFGKPNVAKLKYEKALKIFEKLQNHGFQGVPISETLRNIGIAWNVLGETLKAKEYISNSMSKLLDVYSESHPRVQELKKLLQDLNKNVVKNSGKEL